MDTALVSGPGRQLAALVAPLRECGIDIRVIVFQNPALERTPYRRFLETLGVEHAVVPFRSRFDRLLLPEFRSVLDAYRPHIVQTHSYRPTTLAWLARRYHPAWKWIGFFHGTTNEDFKVRIYHWLDRRLLMSADRLVVMSQSQISRFAPRAGKVVQVRNAVIPSSQPEETELSLRIRSLVVGLRRPRIGVVGRLSTEKGVDVLLDAVADLIAQGFEGSVLIAGDGPERPALEAQAARLRIQESVHFLGSVLPIEPLYPLLDLVVIPSRSEGLPNVLLEALQADLPVVSTRVGAVPEVLEGTAAGLMIPPENAPALAEAIQRSLGSNRRTGESDRAAVVRRFSLERRVTAHVRLYHEVLTETAASEAG